MIAGFCVMSGIQLRVLLAEDDEDDYLITRGFLREIRNLQFDLDWASTYESAEEEICQRHHGLYLF